jgi:hypothetical protein
MDSIPYPPVPGFGRVKLLAASFNYSEDAESPCPHPSRMAWGCFPSLCIVFTSLWPVHGRFINCMLWLRLGVRGDPLAIPRQLFARFEEAGLGSESWRVSQPPGSHPNNTQTPQENGEVKVRTTKRIVRRAEVGNQRLVRSGQKWTEALLQTE